jgi:cytochrome c6
MFWILISPIAPAMAANLQQGQQVFQVHCAGCHAQGGNIVRRGKTLQWKALQRNHVDTLAAIVDLVTHGKANMSAYGDRLTSDEIVNVSSYVLQQAQTGWTP